MRLLITTQKVDRTDPILGFFHRWIEEFAAQCESVIIICLEEGEYSFPRNVKVFSLGKERQVSRIGYLKNFYRYLWHYRDDYDAVLVHMNPEYMVLGGILWRLLGKRIGLWYTHKAVNLKLRIAVFFAHAVFSASRESFRIPTKKLNITGHGIDTDLFVPRKNTTRSVALLTVGRISPSKNILKMLTLLEKHHGFTLNIVGAPVTEKDKSYEALIRHEVKVRHLSERVALCGSVPHDELPRWYNNARAFINLSATGSLDKAVLEALAMDVPVYTTNEAFLKGGFPVHNNLDDALFSNNKRTQGFIEGDHSLKKTIPVIINSLT